MRSSQQWNDLRGFALYDEHSGVELRCSQRLAVYDNETVGRMARGDGLDLRDLETLGHIYSRRSQRVHT